MHEQSPFYDEDGPTVLRERNQPFQDTAICSGLALLQRTLGLNTGVQVEQAAENRLGACRPTNQKNG